MSNGNKKGLHPLAWVAIGCGALVVIVGIAAVAGVGFLANKAKDVVADFEENPARAAAEMVIRVNPELDLVSSDDAAGTITFRNNKTNEEFTLDYDAIKEGKFSVTTDEGEFSVDASSADEGKGVTFSGPEGTATFNNDTSAKDVPSWVPQYPGSTSREGTFSSQTDRGIAGAFTIETPDDVEKALDFLEQLLQGQGYKVSKTVMSGNGSSRGGILQAANDALKRNLNIAAEGRDDGTKLVIQYGEAANDG